MRKDSSYLAEVAYYAEIIYISCKFRVLCRISLPIYPRLKPYAETFSLLIVSLPLSASPKSYIYLTYFPVRSE
jgi:hypothetical protein